MYKRFTEDFQLGIVLLFGFFSASVILPFAIYRFYTGAFLVGILDTVLCLVITLVVTYGWRYGKTERTGKFLVVISGLGALMSSELLGVVGLFWMYVAIVANYFLTTNLKFATVFTAGMMLVLAITGKSFDNTAQMWSFLATSSLLALLSYIIAYQYSMQHAQLKLLATIDPLTGALNRRAMEAEMHLAVEEISRNNSPMVVVLMDIDFFKKINDQHGHEFGDVVLKEFSGLVLNNTRSIDRFFRFGGEEFLMLIKNSNLNEAKRMAEKIRLATERLAIDATDKFTVSMGVAESIQGESCMQWVARADAALYRAKSLGRNRIECA